MPSRLTNLQIRSARPREKKYALPAGRGLCLLIHPNGSKYWTLRYRFAGKQRSVSVASPYPLTSLKEAEAAAVLMRARIAQGFDPQDDRRAEKRALREKYANTFGTAAEAWYQFKCNTWSERTKEQVRYYLDEDILPKLKSRPLDSITPPDLTEVIEPIEKRKALDVAQKSRQWLAAIFSYARAKGWTKNTAASDLRAVAAPKPKSKAFAHVSPKELPGLLHAVAGYQGSITVARCCWMSLWCVNRPGVTRTLKWAELDLDAGNWGIERGREEMKRGYSHITPLPRQAIAMLREQFKITGKREYVFCGRNDPKQPLSEGALQGMFQRIGYKGRQTAHGFRHMVSTALNEIAGDNGYNADWIERQLAHGDPDKIRGTYNEATYLEPRRKMMQAWADHLDALMAQPMPLAKAA